MSLQIRCSIFRQKREQRSSHVRARNTGFYSSPSATIRMPCVLQIRAGIMEFTCNSALSTVHRTWFPKAPRNVGHTAILPHAFRNMRPVSRIYEISLPSVLAATADSFAAAIGFLTSDRWFTREDLLLARFYERLWPAPKPAWCVASPWRDDTPSENEKSFFTADYELRALRRVVLSEIAIPGCFLCVTWCWQECCVIENMLWGLLWRKSIRGMEKYRQSGKSKIWF